MSHMLKSWAIASSGMRAEWKRMQVISKNLANAQTTRGKDNKPYRKQYAVFSTALDNVQGVRTSGTVDSNRPGRRVYDPNHPHADKKGYVTMPNVKVPMETMDMMEASRAYQANLKALQSFREISKRTIQLMG